MGDGILQRGWRRLGGRAGRRRVRRRDRRRLGEWLAANPAGGRLLFVIVVPGTLGWLAPCLKLLPPGQPVRLILNGVGSAERDRLASAFPAVPRFALSSVAGAPVKHGTALDLLLAAVDGDFIVLDHDCYLFDPTLLEAFDWSGDEVVAGVRRQGFFVVNPASGLVFPRTHFLVVRRERLRELAVRHRLSCEKALRTPRRVASLLATIGIGDDNFPPPHLPFYDTLQLLLAVAFAEGATVRWLPVESEGIRHIGGTANASLSGGAERPAPRPL